MKKERIGIFGGTFNPIHRGHVKAALEVEKLFLLDKVLFIPSYTPPHKRSPDIMSPSHRLQMVKLAVASYPQFIPSSIEIHAKGKSYSILTLAKLKKQYQDAWMFFILGMDAFLEIDTWRDYEKLLDQCHIIVISRPGYYLGDAHKIQDGIYKKRMILISDSKQVAKDVLESNKIFLLPIPASDIASKLIRKKIKTGVSIADDVVKSVEKYIRENKLYQ